MVWSVTEDNTFVLVPGEPFLVYDGVPGFGTLLLSIAPTAGTDQYGNSYSAGLNITPNTNGISFRDFTTGIDWGDIVIPTPGAPVEIANAVGFQINSGETFKLGAGLPGEYYFEQVTLSGLTIATGATTQLTGFTSATNLNDYNGGASQFNLATGVWTCPATAAYDFTLSCAFTTWAAASELILSIARGSVGSNGNHFGTFESTQNGGQGTVMARKIMNTGDTVQFGVFQGTGANRTIETGTERSYISVRRAL